MQRHTVTGNRQPFAIFQALIELQHDRRVEFADLDQAQVAGPGFAQQAVELLGVAGVHQYVHGHLLAQLGEGAAHFEVAQVRAHQHLPAFAAQLIAQQGGVDDFDVFDLEAAVPYIEFVEQGISERHVLPEHPPAGRAQFVAPAPVGQPLLVEPAAAPGAGAE